jgi:hypothetical protein
MSTRAVAMRSPYDAANMIERSLGLDLGLRLKQFRKTADNVNHGNVRLRGTRSPQNTPS